MTEDELRSLVEENAEGETLEFKNRLPRTTQLANLLAGFANAQGGKLVVGYNVPTGTFVGVGDAEGAKERVERALEQVEPQLDVNWDFVSVDGNEVLVIDIPRGSDFPYLVNGLAAMRRGDDVVHLTPPEVVERAAKHRDQPANDPVLLQHVAESIRKMEKRGRWTRTLPISVGCAVAGALAGYVLRSIDPLAGMF